MRPVTDSIPRYAPTAIALVPAAEADSAPSTRQNAGRTIGLAMTATSAGIFFTTPIAAAPDVLALLSQATSSGRPLLAASLAGILAAGAAGSVVAGRIMYAFADGIMRSMPSGARGSALGVKCLGVLLAPTKMAVDFIVPGMGIAALILELGALAALGRKTATAT